MKMSPVLRAQYVQWFRSNVPGFKQVMDTAPSPVRAGLAGLAIVGPDDGSSTTSTAVATSDDSFDWGNLIKSLGTAASQYMMTDAQIKANQQITTIQLQRAQQGLPPLPISQLQSQYGITTTPTANVGIAPDTQKLLMYGGIAFLFVWALTSRGRRR